MAKRTHYTHEGLIIPVGDNPELYIESADSHLNAIRDRAQALFPSEEGEGPFGHCLPFQFDITFLHPKCIYECWCRIDFERCQDAECGNPRLSLTFGTKIRPKSDFALVFEGPIVHYLWGAALSCLINHIAYVENIVRKTV